MMGETLGNETPVFRLRQFYRRHLCKYAFFRVTKAMALRCWWPLRNTALAVGMIDRPRLLYRTYLARYAVFRLVKRLLLWVYFRSPRLFTRLGLVLTAERRVFELVPIGQYLVREGLTCQVIRQPTTTSIPGPRFANTCPVELHAQEVVQILEPALEVVVLRDVVAVGGTNLFFSEGLALYPDLQQLERDVIPAEYLGLAHVDAPRSTIAFQLKRRRRRIEQAISLLGNCSGNYAHWLTEILPKLILIDAIDEYDGTPLLVDHWIHPTLLSSIDLLNKKKRALVGVDRWEAIAVDRLVEVSPPAYVQPESRSLFERGVAPEPSPSYFSFSGFALGHLRDAAWEATQSLAVHDHGRRIYLRRSRKATGNGRLLINEEEVEGLVGEYGFVCVEPGNMSFAEQVALFRRAECIVGPIGAALANAIFAPSGCRILALTPYYDKANYYYYSNLMGVLGHQLQYLLGPQIDPGADNVHLCHKNYSVDAADVRRALEAFT